MDIKLRYTGEEFVDVKAWYLKRERDRKR